MDIVSRVGEWLTDGVTSFFNSLLLSIVDTFLHKFMVSLVDIYGLASRLLDTYYVTNTIKTIQAIALLVLVLKMVSFGVRDYILWSTGESRPIDHFMLHGATGVFMVAAAPTICRYTFTVGCAFAEEIATALAFDPTADVSSLFGSTVFDLWMIIVLLAAAIIFIFILVQAAIRAVELTVLAAAAPLLCFGGLKSEGTKSWFRNVLVLSLSQALQIFLLKGLMVNLISDPDVSSNIPFLLVGYLWVIYKGPALLKEWIYSTGMGQATTGTIGSIGRMIAGKNPAAAAVKGGS